MVRKMLDKKDSGSKKVVRTLADPVYTAAGGVFKSGKKILRKIVKALGDEVAENGEIVV